MKNKKRLSAKQRQFTRKFLSALDFKLSVRPDKLSTSDLRVLDFIAINIYKTEVLKNEKSKIQRRN